MDPVFTIQQIDKATIVRIDLLALMEPADIQTLSDAMNELIDKKNQRKIIINFEKVEYLSSRAINILLSVKKKLSDLPDSHLILCSIGPRLEEVIRITRLDKILEIKSTQQEALHSIAD